MRLEELKKGFWGYRKDAVFQYITEQEESFSQKLMEKEAQAVLDSVKANGPFTVIGQEVTDAYLSDSGKHLMIYKDTQTNEQNELHKQEIVEQFQGFKAE